ncbi:hypothetical protein [uncultured Dokdonia sp.]|uniref:hypothetical protein n=1 Tax=uncultured Dokdonia sp. TaxID=575653 RepID=UPI0026115E0A|nr:hypothetical protein [uncultured Dokdonia sp.]
MTHPHTNISRTKNTIYAYSVAVFFILFSFLSVHAQIEPTVKTKIDTTKIRLGEQINYTVVVEADQLATVIFPEGQTFSPLEMIESYKVDTSFAEAKMTLIKKYGLTQFDSGSYKIPKQRILIGDRTIHTDSFQVEVANVVLDTVNQGLYDIKPAIELPTDYSKFWKYLLWILPVILAIALFLFWLLRRHKKRIEAEKYVPPFERALASLRQLDETDFIVSAKYKEYYSTLTDTVRRYYDEKVYDKALESTTDELIARLEAEKDSGHIDFNPETIQQLKDIFKRADLVKFARINPPSGKAEADRLAIEQIVKETKEALPEPTVEELMKDQDFREAMERKRTRKLWLTGISGVVGILLVALIAGIVIKGYDEVKDFVLGNQTRELAEGNWITSEYGFPSIVISTPKVLERLETPIPDDLKDKMQANAFGWQTDPPAITVAVIQIILPKGTEPPVKEIIDGQIAKLEEKGFVANIIKQEEFKTPNGAEGIKTFGTGKFMIDKEKDISISGEYAMLNFVAENIIQQVIITWDKDDTYSAEIAERIINSVELQKAETK